MSHTKDIKKLKFIWIALFALLIFTTVFLQIKVIAAQTEGNVVPESNQQSKLIVHLFWGQGCHLCDEAKPFLEKMKNKYPGMEIRKYEVFNNKDNHNILSQMLDAYKMRFTGVPVFFIGEKSFTGFSEQHKADIEETIKNCITAECIDAMSKIKSEDQNTSQATEPIVDSNVSDDKKSEIDNPSSNDSKETREPVLEKSRETADNSSGNIKTGSQAKPQSQAEQNIIDINEKTNKRKTENAEVSTLKIMPQETVEKNEGTGRQESSKIELASSESRVSIPLLGTVNADKLSLPLATVIIAGIDSFNPCAFFVLLSLLGLLVHARSRKKIFLIGGIFIFFSGLIYFLFMSAWLNLFLVMGNIAAITAVAGIVSVIIAGINIKDFFYFKQGISLTIPDSAKPKLFDRMRKLLKATSLPSILLGTIVLAVAANSYELLCTAGFPLVYTRILTLNNLSTLTYYLYLLLYNLVYIIPLAVIVLIFAVSLGRKTITEKQGRLLKLVSGLMMLGLGLILIINPSLLDNLLVSMVLLLGSVGVTAAAAFITRKIVQGEK